MATNTKKSKKKNSDKTEKNSKKKKSSGPEVGEYNGKPMLILNPEDRFTFQFGLGKAKMILANIEAIEEFVQEHDEEED